jgi:hypothetical protein
MPGDSREMIRIKRATPSRAGASAILAAIGLLVAGCDNTPPPPSNTTVGSQVSDKVPSKSGKGDAKPIKGGTIEHDIPTKDR